MPANRLKEQLKRLQREVEEPETEADIPSDPVEWAEDTLKLQCDPWQKTLLRVLAEDKPARVLCLCPRQTGKTLICSVGAVYHAITAPNRTAVILSPSLRQSSAMMRRIKEVYHAAGDPIKIESETILQLRLVNGSQLVGLPNKEESIRGITASALFFEEAARTPDSLFQAALAFLATVPKNKLIALSTPWGRRGWFFHEYEEGENWTRIKVDVAECPRISTAFLEEQKKRMGPVVYAREFENSFEASENSVFRFDAVEKAIRSYDTLDSLLDSVLDVDTSEDMGDEADEIGDFVYGDIFEDFEIKIKKGEG